MDIISIKDLRTLTKIGCSKEERVNNQEILTSIQLEVEGEKAAKTKNLDDSVCYLSICNLIKEHIEKKEWILLEELAYEIADKCLSQSALVLSAEVEVKKFVIPFTEFTSFKTKRLKN